MRVMAEGDVSHRPVRAGRLRISTCLVPCFCLQKHVFAVSTTRCPRVLESAAGSAEACRNLASGASHPLIAAFRGLRTADALRPRPNPYRPLGAKRRSRNTTRRFETTLLLAAAARDDGPTTARSASRENRGERCQRLSPDRPTARAEVFWEGKAIMVAVPGTGTIITPFPHKTSAPRRRPNFSTPAPRQDRDSRRVGFRVAESRHTRGWREPES